MGFDTPYHKDEESIVFVVRVWVQQIAPNGLNPSLQRMSVRGEERHLLLERPTLPLTNRKGIQELSIGSIGIEREVVQILDNRAIHSFSSDPAALSCHALSCSRKRKQQTRVHLKIDGDHIGIGVAHFLDEFAESVANLPFFFPLSLRKIHRSWKRIWIRICWYKINTTNYYSFR